MRRHLAALAPLGLALALLAFAGQPARADAKPLKPSSEWTGVVNDPKLAKAAPKGGVIQDQEAFAKLWKAWGVKGAAPEVNFATHFVLVELALGGPNVPRANFTLEDGDLRWTAFSTLIGGDAFGYALAAIPREGIKTLKGKPLPAKPASP